MRRKPLNTASRSKLSKYAKPLANLAILLADAGSRLERRFWKKKLFAALAPMLEGRSDTTLMQTLDHLYSTNYRAYDELAFAIENTVESPELGQEEDILLLAAPVLAWSTYNIPSGKIEEATVAEFTKLLQKMCCLIMPTWCSPTCCSARINCLKVTPLPRNWRGNWGKLPLIA